MKFRNWLRRFMAGRNGTDQLNTALCGLTLVLLLLCPLTGGVLSGILQFLVLIGLAVGLFRTFSRNTARRQQENAVYLRKTQHLRSEISGAVSRFRQRRDYRFFRCPSCRAWLRVPKGKGKLNITCRQCGERFTRDT